MDIESIVAAANRAQQAESAKIGNCSYTWHLGFFFDGVHRNIEQDASESRLSNIARLFRAFPDKTQNSSSEGYSKFYISGLGTPFREELVDKLHTIIDGAADTTLDDLKDQPKDMAKDIGLDVVKGSNLSKAVKGQVEKLLDPKEWRSFAVNTKLHIARHVGIEATPWLRDNPVMADFFVTGVDTRITSTKITFEEAFKEVKTQSQVPVKLISISLFGFDLGATLARKFIDTLLDDIFQKQGESYTYQGVSVEIVFTGLFDCARQTPASSNNGVDYFISAAGGPLKGLSAFFGKKSIDQESALPDAIKKALHLVAAHERRPWRSIYRLGDKYQHQEELLPGCAEDIGGGLKPDEQKPSAELCRVALQRMYREASMACVPFPAFQTLSENNPVIAEYFTMNDSVEHLSAEQWVKRYQQAISAKYLSLSAQNHHLDSYIEWLGKQYYRYRREYTKLEDDRRDVFASAGASAGLVGITPQAKEEASQMQIKHNILDTYWGWLKDVHETAIKMKNLMEGNFGDTRCAIVPDVYIPALRRAKRFLAYAQAAYLKEPAPLPFDHAPPEIYAWFMHDIQTIDKGAGITEDFFIVRSLEMPED